MTTRPPLTTAVALRILADVYDGTPLAEAARAHDYSLRTVQRFASRAPNYRALLAHAHGQRRELEGITHGLAGYRRGCRCKVCLKANRDHVAAWRRRQRKSKSKRQRARKPAAS